MSKIVDIKAREILSSNGYPIVETKVITEKGFTGVFASPSSPFKSKKETIDLKDNDSRYFGYGVKKAVENVNTIIRDNIINLEVSHQKEIDEKLIEIEGTKKKSNLGSNAILSVSIACLKAAANEKGVDIYKYLNPKPHRIPKAMFNMVNGGVLSKNNLDFKEYMIVPKMESFAEMLRCASEIFHELKFLFDKEGIISSYSDEGGFTPNVENNKVALGYIVKAIESAGYHPGKDVFMALDVDATSIYDEAKGTYKIENKFLDKEELLDYYLDLLKNYPIISIEDAYADTDFSGFKLISEKLKRGLNIAGDAVFATNKKALKKGIDENICNSIVIKPSSIGTFYEMLETVVLAKKNNYTCIMSHRNSDTADSFIIDVAIALDIPFIKCGSPHGMERIEKYNRLLEIEQILANDN